MRLQAPIGTTHVQSPSTVYPLDAETCIEIPDDHSDVAHFLALGFEPAPSSTPRNTRGSKSAPQPESQA